MGKLSGRRPQFPVDPRLAPVELRHFPVDLRLAPVEFRHFPVNQVLVPRSQILAPLAQVHGTLAQVHGTLAQAHGTLAQAHGTLAQVHGTLAHLLEPLDQLLEPLAQHPQSLGARQLRELRPALEEAQGQRPRRRPDVGRAVRTLAPPWAPRRARVSEPAAHGTILRRVAALAKRYDAKRYERKVL